MVVYRENGKSWSDKKSYMYICVCYINVGERVYSPGRNATVRTGHRGEKTHISSHKAQTIKISIIDLAATI